MGAFWKKADKCLVNKWQMSRSLKKSADNVMVYCTDVSIAEEDKETHTPR